MSDAPRPADPAETKDGFSTTAWSLVLAAGAAEGQHEALERLCRKYWRPAFVFARRSGLSPADAEDVTQEFFAYLLERDWIKQADPIRGSFRAFLLALLRNFLANHRRRQQAEKRRPPAIALPPGALDDGADWATLVAQEVDPAVAYDAAWARGVLQTAWSRLREEQAAAGRGETFEALRPFVTQTPGRGDYDRLAEVLGLNRNRIAVLVHRLSNRFAELIRAEVADTVSDRGEIDSELRYLLEVSVH
jgi:RNA polymerase sigma factor (sigma-70 family)